MGREWRDPSEPFFPLSLLLLIYFFSPGIFFFRRFRERVESRLKKFCSSISRINIYVFWWFYKHQRDRIKVTCDMSLLALQWDHLEVIHFGISIQE